MKAERSVWIWVEVGMRKGWEGLDGCCVKDYSQCTAILDSPTCILILSGPSSIALIHPYPTSIMLTQRLPWFLSSLYFPEKVPAQIPALFITSACHPLVPPFSSPSPFLLCLSQGSTVNPAEGDAQRGQGARYSAPASP